MEGEIEIILNGTQEKVKAGTSIADLISRAQESDRSLIVERNNRFVHPGTYPSTILCQGDRIELINPDFGG